MAVLLDNFIGASTQMELEERLRLTELKAREQQMRNPLESLLLKIAKEFSDSQDLSERLQKLYQVRSAKFPHLFFMKDSRIRICLTARTVNTELWLPRRVTSHDMNHSLC